MSTPETPLHWCAVCNAWHTARPHDDGSMSTPELTVRDREELPHTAGALSGMAWLLPHLPANALDRATMVAALQRATSAIDGVLARDLERRATAQRPICGQDTREAGSRVTVPCALPAGHAGLCSAEGEEEG